MERERNYGIDLLRIVLMFMVCFLHVVGIGKVLNSFPGKTIEYYVFHFLYYMCFSAVNSFAMISGYMATDKPQNYGKIVEMWFQVVFYSLVFTVILCAVGIYSIGGVRELIECMLPLTFHKFWYFSAYVGLFVAIPILNKFLFTIDEGTAKKYFLIAIVLFSIIGLPADTFKTNWGYSMLWLMLLYVIGAFVRIGKIFENKRTGTLVLMWISCIFMTWGMRLFLNIDMIVQYTSPTVLMSGLFMVLIFSRLRLKGKIIAKISPFVFGIYLFHLSPGIWPHIMKGFQFIAKENIIVGLFYAIGISSAIFVTGLCVEFVRSHVAKMMRIPLLSKKIVNWIECFLQKSCILLK